VCDEDASGFGAESHDARRATPARLAEVTFLKEPILDQLTHPLRGDCTAEAGAFDDERPGCRAMPARVVEYRDEVEKAIVGNDGNGARHGGRASLISRVRPGHFRA
jgi:hypothetical protein